MKLTELPEGYRFLNFDRHTVQIVRKDITAVQIKLTQETIASDSTSQAIRGLLSRQLGIYFAFSTQPTDPKVYHQNAVFFCKKWQESIEDHQSLEYAKSCTYLGFALSISEDYRDSSLFDKALKIYQQLIAQEPKGETYTLLQLEQAFSMRCICIINQRDGILNFKSQDSISSERCFKNAAKILSEAIDNQQKYKAEQTDLDTSFQIQNVLFENYKKVYPVYIVQLNAKFIFDWNDDKSIKATRILMDEHQETIHSGVCDINTLHKQVKKNMAQLLYKMATFYAHVEYPKVHLRLSRAHEYCDIVSNILQGGELDWVGNLMAFIYVQQIKLDPAAAQKATGHISIVVSRHLAVENDESRMLLAFAYCMNAEINMASNKHSEAANSLGLALGLYELLNMQTSVQYLIKKNLYANCLAKSGQTMLAELAYTNVDCLWQERNDWPNNRFAGKFSADFANFLGNCGKTFDALSHLNIALPILRRCGTHEDIVEARENISALNEQKRRQVSERERPGAPYFNRPASGHRNQTNKVMTSFNPITPRIHK
jgi:hypothetical protein